MIQKKKSKINYETCDICIHVITSKIELSRDVRKLKSENTKSSGEIGLNIRTNASPKWDIPGV